MRTFKDCLGVLGICAFFLLLFALLSWLRLLHFDSAATGFVFGVLGFVLYTIWESR